MFALCVSCGGQSLVMSENTSKYKSLVKLDIGLSNERKARVVKHFMTTKNDLSIHVNCMHDKLHAVF